MRAFLKVIDPGLMTSIQDLGRFGHQAQGVPVSGALDFGNFRLANALVGNEQGQGAFEIRFLGPTFEVVAPSVRVALAGCKTPIEQLSPEKRIIPAARSVMFQKGDVFRIGSVVDSAVCYLGIEGGLALPNIYGSQSTYVAGGIGGFDGRILQKGDEVPLLKSEAASGPDVHCDTSIDYSGSDAVRVVPGPQAEYFSTKGWETFLSGTYALTAEGNRMGVRLDGPIIEHEKDANINSDGIVTGAIQVPGNGLPIILLADHQTTGGYPKIGVVASADLPKLGRMKPGDTLKFKKVSVAEAEKARRDLEQKIAATITSIEPLPDEGDLLNYRLSRVNLISGVVAD